MELHQPVEQLVQVPQLVRKVADDIHEQHPAEIMIDLEEPHQLLFINRDDEAVVIRYNSRRAGIPGKNAHFSHDVKRIDTGNHLTIGQEYRQLTHDEDVDFI